MAPLTPCGGSVRMQPSPAAVLLVCDAAALRAVFGGAAWEPARDGAALALTRCATLMGAVPPPPSSGPRELLVIAKAAPDATALFDDVLLWFSKAGEIAASSAPARLQPSAGGPLHGYSSLVVTYAEDGCVEAAVAMRSKRITPARFIAQACIDPYRSARPEPAALQQQVDKSMAAFEAREAAAAAAKEAADGKVGGVRACVALRCVALRCVALRCVALRCVRACVLQWWRCATPPWSSMRCLRTRWHPGVRTSRVHVCRFLFALVGIAGGRRRVHFGHQEGQGQAF